MPYDFLHPSQFPVRRTLPNYTKYPVIVPSSTPSYNTLMDTSYLAELGTSISSVPSSEGASRLINSVKDR